MRLSELLRPWPAITVHGDPEVEIDGLVHDSRRVEPGCLFVCVRGTKHDGHDFAAAALAAGAVAVLAERDIPAPAGKTIAVTPGIKAILPELAARFYGYPAERLQLIGVVGTNGKTTSTYLIRSMLRRAGYETGLIGTIQNLVGDRVLPATNTTPGPMELQALLADMAAADCRYVVMEVSSHAIALGRTRGCTFAAGLFTNITQDHLDFHGTFPEYLRVKQGFFADLPPAGWAVINRDDPEYAGFLAAANCRTLTYGMTGEAMVKAENVRVTVAGTSYRVVTPVGAVDLRLRLTGDFNVYNSLGALGVGLALGLDLPGCARGLEAVTGVPGRFQLIPGGDRFGVIVDYAHTPDGLDNLLRTARRLTTGRLIVVFGCGGDRDRGKRPIMGRIAAEYADHSFITSDNPRSEDPRAIIGEIEQGLRKAGKKGHDYSVIGDRAQAIHAAIAMAAPNDLVVIAGKGHETYQIFADRTVHFDDREVAAAALEERKNGV